MKLNRQPFLILVTCFILGILFQDRLTLSSIGVYSITGICILVFSALFLTSYFSYKARPYLLGVLFFGAGITAHFIHTLSEDDFHLNAHSNVVFRITKKLNSTEKNKKYEIEGQSGAEVFNAVLYIPKNHEELDFNHYYQAIGYLSRPESPRADFQFDYARYLKRKNMSYQCYIRDDIASSARKDLTLAESIQQKRLEVLQKIDRAGLSKTTREFLKGIILADRTETDAVTAQDFNRSGLMHFLAISGTHIVVIFGVVYIVLTRYVPASFRKYAIILSLVFIWIFAAFIGFGNSVVRSCIMLSIYYIYVLLQRKPDLLHSLALSAFVILVADTQQLFDVGFQLTFAAVLGIFWLNRPILQYFPKQDHFIKKILFNTVSISIAAQLATLPLVLYYFHQFSFISIIANFVIVPFSEVIIIFSFIMTGMIALDFDFTFLNVIYDTVIRWLLRAIHWFAGFEDAFLEDIPLNLIEMLLLFIIVYQLRYAVLKPDYRNAARMITIIIIFLMIRTVFNIAENRRKEVLVHRLYKNTAFSVKNGSKACFWIQDGSDKERIMRYIIHPYTASRRLDEVVVKTFPADADQVAYKGEIYPLN